MGQGRVRLIRIGDVDLQPCGGTHVAATAEIGPLKLGKIEKKGAQNRRVRCCSPELLDLGRVEQPAIEPQRVLPAGHSGSGRGAKIAVEDLAVVADCRDHLSDEIRRVARWTGRTMPSSPSRRRMRWVFAAASDSDIERGHPGLLRIDQREQRPLDDARTTGRPLARTTGPKADLADALGQDAMAIRIGQAAANGIEPARGRRNCVAQAALIGDREVLAILVEHLV